MTKHVLKYTGIALLLLIGGGVAADRIEEKRVAGFCHSISVGSNFEDALRRANDVLGVDVQSSPSAELLFVESRFSFFRFCAIEGANMKVTKTFTEMSVSCRVTASRLLDCRQ